MGRWLVLVVGLMASTAHAHEQCPWPASTRADAAATLTQVQFRDHHVVVRGVYERRHFERALRVCGETDAAQRFVQWRRLRRLTNWSLVGGLVAWPVLAITPVAASIAGVRKQQVLRQLED
ncbi:MAG: hypothetical protein ACI8PZ_000162 [Myxococcota bacterium]|jgi:hypothetical protein